MAPEAAHAEDPFVPGTTLGRYELLATIGKGGMAKVMLARQRGPAGFEKVVVIKAIHHHMAQDKRAIAMLHDEARVAAQIDHPNVVHTYELDQAFGTFYIVMEYLAGESFFHVLKSARKTGLDPMLSARIVADACAGLHAAHELVDFGGRSLGIVHRDVSPGNLVVLYNGATKVVDFGIAKAHGRVSATQDGQLKGKYGYMSPELIKNEPLDRRADVFSLGVVLWEALARRRLFVSDSVAAGLMMVLSAPRVPPSQFAPGVPPGLDDVAVRALAVDPAARFTTADEMRQAIEDVIWQHRVTVGHVQAYMASTFGERMQQRQALLVSAASQEVTLPRPPQLDAGFGDFDDDRDFDEAPPADDAPGDDEAVRPTMVRPVAVPMPMTVVAPQPVLLPPGAPSVARAASSPSFASEVSSYGFGQPESLLPPVSAPRARWPWLLVAALVAGGATAAIVGFGSSELKTNPTHVETPAPVSLSLADPPLLPSISTSTATATATATSPPPSPPPSPAPAPPPAPSPSLSPPPSAPPSNVVRKHPVHLHPAGPDEQPVTAPQADPPAPAAKPDPERIAALAKTGTEAFLAGRFDTAKAEFEAALRLDHNYAPAYRGLGFTYQRTGDRAHAIEALDTYLRLAPGAADAESIKNRIAQLEDE